jgi:hypothetical protein
MALQLLIAVSIGVITITVHVLGLTGLMLLIPRRGRRPVQRSIFVQAAMILLVVNGLFFLHLMEVLAYALLYLAGGAVRTFRDALVFSAGDYATAGSDVSVQRGWRLMAAMEGATGVFLLGLSTAFFVAVLARIRQLQNEWMDRE